MEIIHHPKYPELVRVRSVKSLDGFRVHLVFTDNTERDVDLEPYLWGPIFEPIRNDPKMFASVFIDPIGQTLLWPNEADIAPETLYYDGNPPWASESKTSKTNVTPNIAQIYSPPRAAATRHSTCSRALNKPQGGAHPCLRLLASDKSEGYTNSNFQS